MTMPEVRNLPPVSNFQNSVGMLTQNEADGRTEQPALCGKGERSDALRWARALTADWG
jgi:hypothetical protein